MEWDIDLKFIVHMYTPFAYPYKKKIMICFTNFHVQIFHFEKSK